MKRCSELLQAALKSKEIQESELSLEELLLQQEDDEIDEEFEISVQEGWSFFCP